jgi:hypothetical protein
MDSRDDRAFDSRVAMRSWKGVRGRSSSVVVCADEGGGGGGALVAASDFAGDENRPDRSGVVDSGRNDRTGILFSI